MDTIKHDGWIGGVGVRAGAPGFATPALEQGGEAADRRRELPTRGIGFGGGAAQRREREPGLHLASPVSRAGRFRAGCRRASGNAAVAADAPAKGRMEIALADGSRVIFDREVATAARASASIAFASALDALASAGDAPPHR